MSRMPPRLDLADGLAAPVFAASPDEAAVAKAIAALSAAIVAPDQARCRRSPGRSCPMATRRGVWRTSSVHRCAGLEAQRVSFRSTTRR